MTIFSYSQADPSHGGTKTPVVRTIESFGAIAGDEIDDSEAFNLALDYFNNTDSTNINYSTQFGVLKFGAGIYLIGKQYDNVSGYGFRWPVYNKRINNVDGLIIEGTTFMCGEELILLSKIKVIDSVYYGYYDISDLSNPIPSYGPLSETIKRAEAPVVFRIDHLAKNVIIRNLELNGNSNNYKLGGKSSITDNYWGSNSFGILCYSGNFISIDNIYVFDFAMDGFYIDHSNMQNDLRWNVTINNSKSYWNGRQGLSWTNGQGLKVEDSDFAYTGFKVGTYDSDSIPQISNTYQSPGSNVIIEPLGLQKVRHGIFIDCNIKGQVGDGSLGICNNSDSIHFNSCSIYGAQVFNQNFSFGKRSIWINQYTNHRNIEFIDCDIKGMIIDLNNNSSSDDRLTSFKNCNIRETKTNFGIGNWGIINHHGKVFFENCNIYQTSKRSYIIGENPIGDNHHVISNPNNFTVFHNSNFISTFDNVLTPWNYDVVNRLYNTRFTGDNIFSHNPENIPLYPRNYLVHNFTINGSSDSANPNKFIFPDFNIFTGYSPSSVSIYTNNEFDSNFNKRPIILGETPCEYLNVTIGSGIYGKGVFSSNTNPLYIGENTILRVKQNNVLILFGPVYLAGKIIVDSGAYINWRYASSTGPHTTFYYLSGTSLPDHLIINSGAHVNVTNPYVFVAAPYGYDSIIVSKRSDLMAPDIYLSSDIDRSIFDSSSSLECFPVEILSFEKSFINTSEELIDIMISPNPTSDEIDILINGSDDEYVIQLLDINGIILKTMKTKNKINTTSLNSFPSGIYILMVSSGSNNIRKKIVKI